MIENIGNKTKYDFEFIQRPEELTVDRLSLSKAEYIFFPHWSYIIPSEIYENFECIIFHMTDLPFGRGGSPCQNLIKRGIYETQITALRCIEELDAGPIYLKRQLSLYGTAEEIFLRASKIMESMIINIINNRLEPHEQIGEVVAFKRLKPADGNLEYMKTLLDIFDGIRMLDAEGYPQAFLKIGPFKFEFARASLKSEYVLADVKISLEPEIA